MGHWSFLGPGSETKWNATDTFKPGGEWDRVAELMMNDLRESGHPIFPATSALDRGHLKSKASGKLSIHFCAGYVAMETIYRTFVSVHQLSIYGAVAGLCEEIGNPLISSEKTYSVMKQSESKVNSADLLDIQRPLRTDKQTQGDLLSNHKERVQNLSNE